MLPVLSQRVFCGKLLAQAQYLKFRITGALRNVNISTTFLVDHQTFISDRLEKLLEADNHLQSANAVKGVR